MVTSRKLNDPEVIELKQKVEVAFGRKPAAPADFDQLSKAIERNTKSQLNADTLSRIWGYKQSYETIRNSTIEILRAYCIACNDSDFADNNTIKSCNLNIGDRLLLEWLPNRKATITYWGDNLFEISAIENSKLSVGDKFQCDTFRIGVPLCLERVWHNGTMHANYIIGKSHGLASCHIEK